MSTRRFRNRLDRLERLLKPMVGEGGATVDPALAKALRQLNALPGRCRYPNANYSEEETRLREFIRERAKAIGCPAGYGAEQARKDWHRLQALTIDLDSPRAIRSATKDAEQARLTALVLAFDQSAEGLGRKRIGHLTLKALMREHELLLLARARLPHTPASEVLPPKSRANSITCARSTRNCRWIPTIPCRHDEGTTRNVAAGRRAAASPTSPMEAGNR
jgi:hypothetical protein